MLIINDYTQNEYNIFKKQNLFPYSKGRTVSGISPIPTQLQSPMTSNTKINSPSKPQHKYQQSEFNHPIQSQDDMFYQKKKKTLTMDFDSYQHGENFYNNQKNNENQSQQVKNQGKSGNLLDIANTFLNSPLMQQISQIDSNQSESASKNFNKQNLLQNYEPYSSSKKANDNLNDESVFSQFNSRIQEEMRSLFMKEQEEEKKINENNQKNKTTFKPNPQEQIQEIDSHKEHDNLHKNDEQEYNTEEQIQNYQQQQEQFLLQQQLKQNQLKQQQIEDENQSKNDDHEQYQQLNQNLDNQEQIQNQWNNKEYPQERNYSFNKKEFQ
ncbi:hypothetical protein PPERSA_07809 [Pseudocohnilembus persalinus]|uniref:Uncharacterized protein n=1 Tax=Pseudocohnilembus persalinus TaxID=266149 RepID=A0A0V0QCF5_PSEPJ|nr:hypothetical protein PPERSA_07809 [Pseudocohnilembus persalinus]|eukprot:KRW99732.1 hypothetical protein PPERSA_07809 [Pseudocohnilembus persalinus]